MPFVPPMVPRVVLSSHDESASIVVVATSPAPIAPTSGVWDSTYSEIAAVASTYASRLAVFPTYAAIAAYRPVAPIATSVDVWRREQSVGGVGIRIGAGLTPGVPFTDWTPASGVEYEYRATAHASSNGTSTDGPWSAGATGPITAGYSATYQGSYG